MTGRHMPANRTDDIRRTFAAINESAPMRWTVAAAIVTSSIALLTVTVTNDMRAVAVCHGIVTFCTVVFTIEVSLQMIGQRVGFLGKPGNVALLAVVACALFTPFDAVLMLRLFPLLKNGVEGHRAPRILTLLLVPFWIVACTAAGARNYVILEGGSCVGWGDCTDAAVRLLAS